jgi:hypothetical protein
MRNVRALACAALVAFGALPVVTGNAAPRCANEVELLNQWTAVPIPRTSGPVNVAQADDDPCMLVATDTHQHAFRSADGGLHWSDPVDLPVAVDRPVMATLPPDRVALTVPGPAGGGLLVSGNGGRSYAKASGLDGVTVLTLHLGGTKLYATGRGSSPIPAGTLPPAIPAPTAGPSMWTSTDFGASWLPVPASAALGSSTAVTDPGQTTLVWANSATAGGVWLSDDGGSSFVRKDGTNANDLDTSLLDGGGSTVLASTGNGLRRSNNGGDTWTQLLGGTNVRELAYEHRHPTAFMLVADGGVRRSATSGKNAHPESDGLPAGCDPHGLAGDHSQPTTFLVTCGKDGRAYRYRSDGKDLPPTDPGDPPNPGLAPRLPRSRMSQLAEIELPDDADGESAAIAFDGQLLYYTLSGEHDRVHRVDARTGSVLPPVKIPIHGAVAGLTYDSLRHFLYVLDARSAVWEVNLRDLRTRKLFVDPIEHDARFTSYSYDAAIGRFRAVNELSTMLYEIDLGGEIAAQCDMPAALLYLYSGGAPGAGDGAATGPAAVVASGDGGVYVQNEDDSTIVRYSRSCEPLAVFEHRVFSEASLENDQVACDTNTFDEPAVWIRDASAKAAYAFAVPGGYCALATKIRVTTSPTVANTGRAPVCAELRLAGKDLPIAGEEVALYAGRHEVGRATTGPDGVACATYHPADFPEYATPDRPSAGSRPIDRKDREQVVANYVGTQRYRPARGLGQAVVTTFVLPLDPLAKPPAVHLPPPVLEPAIVAAPPPPLPVAPPQPPPPASQPQPLAQGHPGAQPGALGQPGAAAQPGVAAEYEEDVQAADQSADVREFRARSVPPSPELPMAVVGFAFAAALLEQRRRRSRVREVGA